MNPYDPYFYLFSAPESEYSIEYPPLERFPNEYPPLERFPAEPTEYEPVIPFFQEQYPQENRQEVDLEYLNYLSPEYFSASSAEPTRTTKYTEARKRYLEKNKDRFVEYSKQYYQKNREKKLAQAAERRKQNEEYYSERVQCNRCGAWITRLNLRKHQRSRKCSSTP